MLGDALGFKEAYDNPSWTNIGLAAGSLIPGIAEGKGALKSLTKAIGYVQNHHVLPISSKNMKELKDLGINLNSPGNIVKALEGGGTLGHRQYTEKVRAAVSRILELYNAGVYSKLEALKKIAAVRRSERKDLLKKPEKLLETMPTGSSVESSPSRSSKSPGGNYDGGGGGSCGNWSGGC